MIVQQFLELCANNSGISDNKTLMQFFNQALQEFYIAEDFPGTLMEESFKPYDAGMSKVSLPCQVMAIRGVRPCLRMTTDVMVKETAVMDDQYIYSPWKWRQVKRTPLIRNLEEASQLTIKRRLPTATEEVIVTLGGPSDVAESAQESLLLTSSMSEIQTKNQYEDLTHLVKDVITECDIDVYDAAGNLVASIPNNYLEVYNTIIQITSECNVAAVTTNCVLVMYKPTLPPLLRETDVLPEWIDQAIYFNFRAWLDLHSKDMLDRGAIYADKAAAIWNRSAMAVERGQVRPFNTRRSTYTPYAGYRL